MNTKTLLGILFILIIGVGIWAFTKGSPAPEATQNTTAVTETNEAWIEIIEGTAFLKTGGQGTPLKSGDALQKGVSVETGSTGRAVIHFPDGSVLRMDKSTSVTLDNVYFKSDDHTLSVSIGLTVGRVWSKVVGLATPESSWEVKTSNSVATVRGTAFGMGYKNGRSWVLGSENKVAVAPLDPISKEKLANAEVTIEADKQIEITDSDVKTAINATTTTGAFDKKVVPITDTFSKDVWVQDARKDDAVLDKKIEDLQKTEGDLNKAREKLIEDAVKARLQFQPEIENQLKKIDEAVQKAKDSGQITKEQADKLDVIKDSVKNAVKAGISGTPTSGGNLLIKTSDKTEVLEGTTIKFTASFKDSGGNSKDVTNNVSWASQGFIGNVSSSGVFVAKLGAEISEVGDGAGFVIGSYKDPLTGAETKALSPLIRVHASGPQTPLDIGGQ